MMLALIPLVTVPTFLLVTRWQSSDELREVDARLTLHATALTTELGRLASMPEIVAMDNRLAQALTLPNDAARLGMANDYLEQAQQRTGAEAVFLINAQGLTIAASNHAQSASFVGQNYFFRPYFRQALASGIGRFYAVGATTGRPGYFLAASVSDDQTVLGVLAIKISLDSFALNLQAARGVTLVADEVGVIILASHDAFQYRTLSPLSDEQLNRIRQTRQYVDLPLKPLITDDSPRARPVSRDDPTSALLAQNPSTVRHGVHELGWTFVAFTDTPNATKTATLAAIAAALTSAGLVMLLHIIALRAQRHRDLQQAEVQIQQRIAAGTLQLREQLQEQARTEAVLRATTDSAVQAGKLAVLGQMAGAISHELNQPLTAVRSFSENARLLLTKGRLDDVRQNLERICSLSDRMGQIVAQLSTHLRKQPGKLVPVHAGRAIESALQLLSTLREESLPVTVQVEPPDVNVMAQPVRLEQVLINLLRNALEAQPSDAMPHVRVRSDEACVRIQVRDHGPGIDAEAMDHLFEPFFTTKPQGHGLGLGLAVSVMIVNDMGGELLATNEPAGGASFTIVLPRADHPPPGTRTDSRSDDGN